MAATRNEALGNWVNDRIENNRLYISATNAELMISQAGENCFRICIDRKLGRDFSYAVVHPTNSHTLQITSNAEKIQLQASSHSLIIQKFPLRISFQHHDGKVLCEDDPAFGTSWLGNEVTTYKKLQANERFIGLGEKTGHLDRRGTAYTNWNTDKFAYAIDQDPLYMSIPFYIGLHSGLQYGVFFDNSYKTKFNFGASNDRFTFFTAEDGVMDYYLIGGDSVADIIRQYTTLTGRAPLPPIWSLGLQQCRYSYYPDSEVLNVARTFREKEIPCDMIYLDIHYMDAYKVCTFDKKRFPTPEKMVKDLREQGFHLTVILDPGVKMEAGYKLYEEGLAEKMFAQYPDGENFTGTVWPGQSHFPDFTNEKVRQWWGKNLQFYTEKSIDGFWNDMNEPAMWGQSPPDLWEFHYEGETSTHKRARNIYGMQMARSTYEGVKKLLQGKRPFVLNRAGYSGVQRYAASWTGDNVASNEHMLCGVRLINSLGLCGVAFAGYDVGGFCGDASPELFMRWIVLGAFSPLFRCHSMINSRDAEPWTFGEEAEEVARNYIKLRYRLLPYIYAQFFKHSQDGLPIAQSLALYYAHDEKIYNPQYQEQYFFGDAFLVPAITTGKELAKVYLPAGEWYCLHSDKKIGAGEYITEVRNERYPLFIKASSIITMQRAVQHTAQKNDGVLEIHLYHGSGAHSTTHYEDDGTTYQYEMGHYHQRELAYFPAENSFCISAAKGSLTSQYRSVQLWLHGFKNINSLHVNGQVHQVYKRDYQFVPPVSGFDPFYQSTCTDMQCRAVQVAEFDFLSEKIKVVWS